MAAIEVRQALVDRSQRGFTTGCNDCTGDQAWLLLDLEGGIVAWRGRLVDDWESLVDRSVGMDAIEASGSRTNSEGSRRGVRGSGKT